MQTNVTLSKKSGKGISDGVISELTAFFGVKPGHEEQLREALVRFTAMIRSLDPLKNQKIGLRDTRHVLFDNDTRLLWTTTFETDWDPYLDDALLIVGVEHFIDWMQHVTEANELIAWLQSAGGAEALTKIGTPESIWSCCHLYAHAITRFPRRRWPSPGSAVSLSVWSMPRLVLGEGCMRGSAPITSTTRPKGRSSPALCAIRTRPSASPPTPRPP
jgi:hypothetical protein